MKKDSITNILNYLETYGTYKIDNNYLKKFYNVLIESYYLQSENQTFDSTIGKILEIQPLNNLIKTIATDRRHNSCAAKRFLLQFQDKRFNGLVKDFHLRLLSQLRLVEDLMKQYKIEVTEEILLNLDKNLSELEIENIMISIDKINRKEDIKTSCDLKNDENNSKETSNYVVEQKIDVKESIINKKGSPSCVVVSDKYVKDSKELLNRKKTPHCIVSDKYVKESIINKKESPSPVVVENNTKDFLIKNDDIRNVDLKTAVKETKELLNRKETPHCIVSDKYVKESIIEKEESASCVVDQKIDVKDNKKLLIKNDDICDVDLKKDSKQLLMKKEESAPTGFIPIGQNIPFSSVQLSVTKINTKSSKKNEDKKMDNRKRPRGKLTNQKTKESCVNDNEHSEINKKQKKIRNDKLNIVTKNKFNITSRLNENTNTNFDEVLKRSRRKK